MPHFESSERSRTTQVDDLGVPRLPQCPICKSPCYFAGQPQAAVVEQRDLIQAIQLSQEAASSPSATPSPSLSPSPRAPARAAARAMHPLRLASHLSAPPPGVEVVDLLDDDDDDDDVDDPGDDDSLRHIGRPPRISGPADATVSSTRREGASAVDVAVERVADAVPDSSTWLPCSCSYSTLHGVLIHDPTRRDEPTFALLFDALRTALVPEGWTESYMFCHKCKIAPCKDAPCSSNTYPSRLVNTPFRCVFIHFPSFSFLHSLSFVRFPSFTLPLPLGRRRTGISCSRHMAARSRTVQRTTCAALLARTKSIVVE